MAEARNIAAGRGRLGIASATVSALVGLLLLVLPFGRGLVELSYDTGSWLRYWLREDPVVTEALIVYMDEPSHRRLGQPWMARWDRSWHARLIERLSALGATAVAFDLLFDEPGPPAADEALVTAAKTHGKVVVAAVRESAFIRGEAVGTTGRRAFAALSDVTVAGVVEQAFDGGGRFIRKHYLDADHPELRSLAWQASALASGNPPSALAERWLNYYGPPGFIPHRSYFELFETNNEAALASAVSNRVVFVGAQYSVGFTGGKGTDDFQTPYTFITGRVSPGVEVNATTFLNLVRRDWLRRPPAFVELAAVLLAGAALGAGLMRLRPHVAAAFAIAVVPGTAVGATASAWVAGVWLPWCVVAFAQLPVALAFSVLGQSRQLAREKRAFEQALALASEGRGTTTRASSPGRSGNGAEAGAGAGAGGNAAVVEPMVVPEFLRELRPGAARDDLPRVPDHELIRCVGRGGYGEVWLARDIFGALHAVKLMRLANFSSATPLQTEFEGLKRFTPISRSHPGLVHILHVGRDEGHACLYCVMELADDAAAEEGATADGPVNPETYVPRTLAQELARGGRMPLPTVLELGIALGDAVGHLHANNLVHRDIKPANIVYVKGRPKLADAGLVATAVAGGKGLTHLGTPGRIAPEGTGTPAADVFSLGKVLYEAGLGMDVDRFPELPPSMIQSGADRELFEFNRVIMRACEVDVRRRWASAAELRQALVRIREAGRKDLPAER